MLSRHRESDSTPRRTKQVLRAILVHAMNSCVSHRFPLSRACPFNPATMVTAKFKIKKTNYINSIQLLYI